jgi:hypothetical protein
MNLRIDEVMGAYANILNGTEPSKTPEMLWHANVDFSEPRLDLVVDQISMETNAIVTASDNSKELISEKGSPFDNIEDMIEKAHPKPVYIADAMGDGGLVENQNELQSKIISIVNRYPSGTNLHRTAFVLESLLKIAEGLDTSGDHESALIIDSFAEELSSSLKKKSSLNKHAFWPLVGAAVAGILALLGGSGVAWHAYKGRHENLLLDISKVIGNIESWKDQNEYASIRGPADDLHKSAIEMQSSAENLMNEIKAYTAPDGAITSSRNQLEEAMNDLLVKHDDYKSRFTLITESLAHGSFFILLKSYTDNVDKDIKLLIDGLVQAGNSRHQGDQFDSPEMEKAVVTPAAEAETAPTPKTPLSLDETKKVQSFINQAYKPIGYLTGVVDETWYAGLKSMVSDIKKRLANSVMVQDSDEKSAAEAVAGFSISDIVQMNNDGTYSMVANVKQIYELFNFVDDAENAAEALTNSKIMKPHESLLH